MYKHLITIRKSSTRDKTTVSLHER